MATPPSSSQPPSSPTQPRMFVMEKHMQAMRNAQPPRLRRAHSQPIPRADAAATADSPSSARDFTSGGTDSNRKRTRRYKAGDATPRRLVPTHTQSLHDVFSAEPNRPPRKPAAIAEKDDLAEQVRLLEARVEAMRLRAGLPTAAETQAVRETKDRNAEMDEMIHTNRRYAVQLQSLATQQLQLPPVNPLATFIHLPCDKEQRCRILQDMKYVKLRRAATDGLERYKDLESSVSYVREERFTTEDACYHCNRFEVAVFPQFRTARQIYDAMVFWFHNLEISVTEMIDHTSLREDNADADTDITPTIWNQRLITQSADVGCIEELNYIGFAQFYESYDLLDGKPLGVIAIDTVDVDDLHPYKPLERTRKNIQTYFLFSEFVDPETQHKSVQMKSTLFHAQLPPQFPIEPRVIEKLHENMSRWPLLMNQYLSDFVVPP